MKVAIDQASKAQKNDEEGAVKQPFGAWVVYVEEMKRRGEKPTIEDGYNQGEHAAEAKRWNAYQASIEDDIQAFAGS